MSRQVLPGTLQIRVIADKDKTEEVSKKLITFLEGEAMEVVECTPDFADRFDDGRRKFHITAIPSKAKEAFMTPGVQK
jgi:hypothetical protein